MDNTQQVINTLLKPINQFLQCETPNSWIEEAIKPENLIPLLRSEEHTSELQSQR